MKVKIRVNILKATALAKSQLVDNLVTDSFNIIQYTYHQANKTSRLILLYSIFKLVAVTAPITYVAGQNLKAFSSFYFFKYCCQVIFENEAFGVAKPFE